MADKSCFGLELTEGEIDALVDMHGRVVAPGVLLYSGLLDIK